MKFIIRNKTAKPEPTKAKGFKVLIQSNKDAIIIKATIRIERPKQRSENLMSHFSKRSVLRRSVSIVIVMIIKKMAKRALDHF